MESSQTFEKEFVTLARDLFSHFPELDIRMIRKCGTAKAQCLIPGAKPNRLEFDLSTGADHLLYNAVWAIKQAAGIYDS